jgi:ABC-2 type transport system permease protein
MLSGLGKLTWLEIKIFMREPLGVIGSIVIPTVLFLALGRIVGGRTLRSNRLTDFVTVGLPVFVSVMIAISTALSLITIMAIYREGGILKRLRATPLRPHTILAAHVAVKLFMTVVTLLIVMAVGSRYYPVAFNARLGSFAGALLFGTMSILAMGFLIASLAPSGRFAQPLGSLILYPMLGLSGLFVPVEEMPARMQAIASVLPLTYAVSLLRGAWIGEPWSAHLTDVAALTLVFVICSVLSARLFRWQ